MNEFEYQAFMDLLAESDRETDRISYRMIRNLEALLDEVLP